MFKNIKRTIIEKLGGSADRIYPVSYQAVDIVVIRKETNEILLGRKWANRKARIPKAELRFLGGFVDPSDPSLEFAARRELREEAGVNLEVSDPVYIGSFRVDDPRYKDKTDKIMSAVFLTQFVYGFAKGGDDIAETVWAKIPSFKANYHILSFAPEHKPLVEMLIEKKII